jgi:predicted acyl esterase
MTAFDRSPACTGIKRTARTLLAAALSLGLAAAPAFAQRAPAGPAVPQGEMGAGTEGRSWADPSPAPPQPAPAYKIKITENVKIPMRDGIKLDSVLYVPEREKPAGCILVFDGYGWSFDPRDRRFAEEQGYAVLNVSTRGVFESEGVSGLYDTFIPDGYDTVEWMAKQSWCADGNVGMFGSSLPGNAIWQVANARPPHLKAIAPDVACANCYQTVWHPGGTRLGPGRESRAGHEYEAVAKHPDRDAWWEMHIVDPKELAAIARTGMGMMITGGLQDFITVGAMDAFSTVQKAGAKARLMVDGGAHSSARNNMLGPYHHATHMDLFFAHFLRGENNAWADSAIYKDNVLLYIMGPNTFRWEKTWPIADAKNTKLYLRAKASGTIEQPPPRPVTTERPAPNPNDGSLSTAAPTADEAPMRYTYFPENGPFLPTGWTQGDGWPKIDQTEYSTKAVSWTTDAMTVPTEVTGNIVFDFSASSSAGDTDFMLMVTDVAPDGTSRYISAGSLNSSHYPNMSKPKPLKPGEIRKFQMVVNPIAYVFQPGHRIRFSLAGGVTPLPLPGQTGAEISGKNPNYAKVTIFQNAANPATLTIPVIGTGSLVAPAQ